MKRLTLTLAGLAISALAFTTTGCLGNGKATGGGWMPSTVEGEKVTFGFHSMCEASIGKASLSYKDHGADVSFKISQLELDDTTHANTLCGIASIDEFVDGAGFVGFYAPQPANAGPGGIAFIVYEDNGLPGKSNEDLMLVVLLDGIYDGYANLQLISHGQVNVSPE